jgi:hypothetical protein
MPLRMQVHARQLPQIFRRKPPIPGLVCQFDECSSQNVSGDLDHFSVIVSAHVQAYRHLETDLPAIDLKCNADLRGSSAAHMCFDARELDLELAHAAIQTRFPHAAVVSRRGLFDFKRLLQLLCKR